MANCGEEMSSVCLSDSELREHKRPSLRIFTPAGVSLGRSITYTVPSTR